MVEGKLEGVPNGMLVGGLKEAITLYKVKRETRIAKKCI
jgi:hypothetical protein